MDTEHFAWSYLVYASEFLFPHVETQLALGSHFAEKRDGNSDGFW